jgi:hypothetical protein
MKPNIYSGELNSKRIAAYQKLAEEYGMDELMVGIIFCKGADWGINLSATENQRDKSECSPDECSHPIDRRTYYEGGTSWCTKCWSYVDLPLLKENCKHFDEAQGRNRCLHPKMGHTFFTPHKCTYVCKHFEKR